MKNEIASNIDLRDDGFDGLPPFRRRSARKTRSAKSPWTMRQGGITRSMSTSHLSPAPRDAVISSATLRENTSGVSPRMRLRRRAAPYSPAQCTLRFVRERPAIVPFAE